MHSTSRRIVMVAFTAIAAVFFSVLTSAQAPTFTAITGEIGPGSLYEIDLPTAPWNGELVVFVQGIGGPANPIDVPNPGTLRDTLTSQGFGLIYTSRDVNGYGAVKDGMIRTHQLRGIFAAHVGQPAHTYLLGRSLGGLISVMLVERFPDQYDGAVSGSGLMGGGAAELQYLGDAHVLFDYFFPGVVPGEGFHVPVGVDFTPGGPTYIAVLTALQQGLSSPGQPTLQFARTAHLPGATVTEIINAAMTVIGFTVVQGNDLMALVHEHMPYDNTDTVYSGSADDVALNADVERFVGEPSAENYMEHYYTPTGDLRVPLITLHKTRDPLVPIFHESIYAGAVANAGASQYLLQRTIVGFGHGNFAAGVEATALNDLVQWVHTGIKPQQ